MTDDEILAKAKEIEERRIAEYQREEANIEARIRRGDTFTDDELRYAARARCSCGAGLAYPPKIGMHGSWFCSDWLTRRNNSRDGSRTHDEYPFMFYEIKSEDQPSACGATTRGKHAAPSTN